MYVLVDATLKGGIAVPLTPSPLTVFTGESPILTYLIALVNKSLNVISSIEVEHDFDGYLNFSINSRGNDHYDVIFPPIPYGFFVDIIFNRMLISTEFIDLDVQSNN